MNTRSKQDEMLATFSKMLDEKLKPVTERLEKIEHSLTYALDELKKISDFEDKISAQDRELQYFKNEMTKVNEENCKLKDKIIRQETYSRKNNLRLMGINISPGQSIEQALIQNLAKVGLSLDLNDIERAHYISKHMQKEVILVRFLSWRQKETVMKLKPKLVQIGVTMQDDLPMEVIESRRLLLPVFFKARELYPQMNPKLQLDRFIFGGKIYTKDNIHTITYPELHPESVFTPSRHGIQAFYTKSSPLSNHYACEFQLDGKCFFNAEQCLMYKKALLFKDQHTADKMLRTHDPVEAKTLGRSVSGFNKDTWMKKGPDCMFEAMTAKFSQNDKLKVFLKATGKNVLVEASPSDKFWGCGLSLRNKAVFDNAKWTGLNTAGKTLEHVRLKLC